MESRGNLPLSVVECARCALLGSELGAVECAGSHRIEWGMCQAAHLMSIGAGVPPTSESGIAFAYGYRRLLMYDRPMNAGRHRYVTRRTGQEINVKISDYLKRPAREVMVTDIVTLSADETLAMAASKFLAEQISGAPVVDNDGTCVGVLTITDVMRATEEVAIRRTEATDAFFSNADLLLPATVVESQLSQIRDELLPAANQPVSSFMTTDIVSIQEHDQLETVVRDFVNADIHRVLVFGADQETGRHRKHD